MKILVLSRKEIEKYHGTAPYVVISICDKKQEAPDFPDKINIKDILHIEFEDTLDPNDKYGEAISEDDAERILRFVDAYRLIYKELVIHCEAGISRSWGIAIAISTIFNWKIERTSESWPNALVVRRLLKKSFELNGIAIPDPVIIGKTISCSTHPFERLYPDLDEENNTFVYCSKCDKIIYEKNVDILKEWDELYVI